jgi:hypothetical protein
LQKKYSKIGAWKNDRVTDQEGYLQK